MSDRSFTSSSKSLVLVVGAGASMEVGLPIGAELKDMIVSDLDFSIDPIGRIVGGEIKISDALYQLAQSSDYEIKDINSLYQASILIRNAMPQAPSIDNFIDSHKTRSEVALCGKLAITSSILKAERRSRLFVDETNSAERIKFSEISKTWFNALFQLICLNTEFCDINKRLDKIAIISFNYDRCLEHFLHQAFQNYYSISPEVATATLNRLSIFHPYGTVGKLPWVVTPQYGGTSFGSSPYSTQLVQIAKQIKTFTEGTDENESDILSIRSLLKEARKIAFLGFAYHPLNLELLFGEKGTETTNYAQVFGTAKGISKSNIEIIKSELSNLGGYERNTIQMRDDLTAAELFDEYSRSLSLE